MSTVHDENVDPPCSPFLDGPSDRTISFSTTPVRPSSIYSRASASYADTAEWSDVLEDRLALVQDQLKKAQRRWSESQDIWLEEEQSLLELKRRHKKSTKSDAAIRKFALAWKAKTFNKPKKMSSSRHVSRKNSAADSVASSAGASGGDDDSETAAIEGHKLERTNTGTSITNAFRRFSLSVRGRSQTAPVTPEMPEMQRFRTRSSERSPLGK